MRQVLQRGARVGLGLLEGRLGGVCEQYCQWPLVSMRLSAKATRSCGGHRSLGALGCVKCLQLWYRKPTWSRMHTHGLLRHHDRFQGSGGCTPF